MDEDFQGLSIAVCSRVFSRNMSRALIASLQAGGANQVTQVQDGPLKLSPAEVVLVMGNANWFPTICRQLATKPKSERPCMVIWHYEPLPPPAASGLPWPRLSLREIVKILLRDTRATDVYTNYFRLRSLARQQLPDLLVVSARGGCEFLAERGFVAHWVPLGYSPSQGYNMGLARDIDVLFIGALEIPRRKRLIAQLRRQGINLLAVGDWSDPSYWGENRTRILNRAKIILNLQRFPGQMSGQRLILGLANMALVISEPMYNPAPYVPGKHYISAPLAEIPALIRYYLAHEDERAAIASEGHRFVTQEVTLRRSVSCILKLIQEEVRIKGRYAKG